MADQKPPRYASDERTTLTALLQYQRDSFVRTVDGVPDADARRALVPTGTSLLGLTRHLARAEQLWFVVRFAGDQADVVDDEVRDTDSLAAAIDTYRATWTRVDSIIAASSLDDECRNIGADAMVNLRWVVAHLLEETARHAGHADIIREQIDGATGR